MGGLDGGELGGDLLGAVVGEHPPFHGGADVIELVDLDEDGRHGRCAAGNELEVADGREEGGAAASAVLPAFARLEADRALKRLESWSNASAKGTERTRVIPLIIDSIVSFGRVVRRWERWDTRRCWSR